MGRIILAFKWFFRILFGPGYSQIQQLEAGRKPQFAEPESKSLQISHQATSDAAVKPRTPDPALTVAPPEKPPEKKEGTDSSALKLLAILQQEGRFIDFLQEDISSYTDEQVGGAVRTIHSGCRKAIVEYATVEAVLQGEEGGPYQVPSGFDPHRIRVVGNVVGNPPFSGILRHHGWRVVKLKLPSTPPGQDLAVIAPAEVEV